MINQKDFLARYGKTLLRFAIKNRNKDLVKNLIEKTLEYFKKDPNRNIYILSVICMNMNRLSRNYADFLLEYYDEMEKRIFDQSKEHIYNNFGHIHSFSIELKTHDSIYKLKTSFKLILHHFIYKLKTIFKLKPHHLKIVFNL